MNRFLLHLFPSKYVRREVLKEFALNRFWLNHYECVDFTVFEYGQRSHYLQWRVFSFLITVVLTAHVFYPSVVEVQVATPFSRFIYMHAWVSVLLVLHNLSEIVVLVWMLYTIRDAILVRIHNTPWQLKLLWLTYNSLYPNMMSCNFMYYVVVKNMGTHIGESRLFVALLASLSGIQASVTAIPSRLAHIAQPLLFNVLHIVFTAFYQLYGLTDHAGNHYVYMEIDWMSSVWSSIGLSMIWLLMTTLCHLLMVCCCWYRRIVYRSKRTPSAKPVYGFSPEEYYPCSDYSDDASYFEIPLDKDENDEEMIGTQPCQSKVEYSPHMSYREATRQAESCNCITSLGHISTPPRPRGSDPISRRSLQPKSSGKVNFIRGRKALQDKLSNVCTPVGNIIPDNGKISKKKLGKNTKRRSTKRQTGAKSDLVTTSPRDDNSDDSVKFSSETDVLESPEGPDSTMETHVLVSPQDLRSKAKLESTREQEKTLSDDEDNDSLSDSFQIQWDPISAVGDWPDSASVDFIHNCQVENIELNNQDMKSENF